MFENCEKRVKERLVAIQDGAEEHDFETEDLLLIGSAVLVGLTVMSAVAVGVYLFKRKSS